MRCFSEMEIYSDDSFESEISDEDFDFYFDELSEIRNNESGILLCWIVPDEDCGHIECCKFDTWTDLAIWKNQK